MKKKMQAKKPRFTAKNDRMAGHVAASEKKRGMPAKEAKSVGYAVVNKMKSRKKTSDRPVGQKEPQELKRIHKPGSKPPKKPSARRKRNIGRS